jgi:hypothetical protein
VDPAGVFFPCGVRLRGSVKGCRFHRKRKRLFSSIKKGERQGVKKTRRTLENKGRDGFFLILIIYRNNVIFKKALKPLILLGLWRFFGVDREKPPVLK